MKHIALGIIAGLFSISGFCGELTGKVIPETKVKNQNGTVINVNDLKGQWVVLYFYPKDDTPGCTREAKTFNSLMDQFKAHNTVIFGISSDSAESHKKFIDKYGLKFDLLVDEDNTIADSYNVKTLFGMCSRDTILINPEGIVEKEFRKVSPEGNPEEILNYIKSKK